ncbi:glutathione S-transferase, C-terminal domain protein [Collimonas fungivorans]|uniref:Glutathione S-transferase, C-terminal domain protein n=1 Tax=Collimonas fungivorans TaxID=158899 RepID=A0A127P4M7_9BURK|nr:glutathione transferase GstA [Collimonas fungivorans]AMO92796.1 glutathione S-transferase, C-terminal domain protein [Collimonas fungivorans]
MKLYFAPETCSLSPHIVLRELGLRFELVKVDNKTKRTADGQDFLAINPKGYVAALQLENGEVLTEGPAIVQYLADLKPEAGLAPANGSWQRVRLQESLNFITSEIHAGLSPLFNTTIPDGVKAVFKDKLQRRLDQVASTLGQHDYLLGAQFGVADAYLFTVLRWTPLFAIDLNQWPAIARYMENIGSRATVKAALAAEAAA